MASANGNGGIAILFSGGSDSTLTAALMAEQFERVHLVTYRHRALFWERKCLTSLAALRRAHPERCFVHSFVNINPVLDRLYFRALAEDLRRYGSYALPLCCGACKLAMHVATIEYCRAQGIAHAADGSNVELSELFPEQMVPVLELYRGLYARFGIEYRNPVFSVRRSDHRLYERGVTRKKDYKTEHVIYSNQHSCVAGVLLYAYTLGISLPLLRRSSRRDVAEGYIRAKIEEVCVPYLAGGAA